MAEIEQDGEISKNQRETIKNWINPLLLNNSDELIDEKGRLETTEMVTRIVNHFHLGINQREAVFEVVEEFMLENSN